MRILLIDDHSIVRSGLRRLLSALPDVQISEAATGQEALTLTQAEQPALTILDLNLPGLGGLELLKRLLQEHPNGRVIVLSMYAHSLYATRALRVGAVGYLSKNASPEELLEAVQRVIGGGSYVEAELAQELAVRTSKSGDPIDHLSERNLEIMRLLGDGQSLSDIAAVLGVTYKTIANTCSQIKAKLGVERTADLVRLSVEKGLT
jgi:two-component system, NarL family, invasion response regulator UvrY